MVILVWTFLVTRGEEQRIRKQDTNVLFSKEGGT